MAGGIDRTEKMNKKTLDSKESGQKAEASKDASFVEFITDNSGHILNVNIDFTDFYKKHPDMQPKSPETMAGFYKLIKKTEPRLRRGNFSMTDLFSLASLFLYELSKALPKIKTKPVTNNELLKELKPIVKAYLKNARESYPWIFQKLEADLRAQRVRKPKSFTDSEVTTYALIRQRFDKGYLPFFTEKNLDEFREHCESTNIAMAARSYPFLTDALFAYAYDYAEGRRDHVKIDTLSDRRFMVIEDSWNAFCIKAGATRPDYRRVLVNDIEAEKFVAAGVRWKEETKSKKDNYRFTSHGFIEAHEFIYQENSKLKNLRNIDRGDGIDAVFLAVREELFASALYPQKKGSKTRGYWWYPYQLELRLRQTVEENRQELREFCEQQKFKHIKGGTYIGAIRPLFDALTRETQVPPGNHVKHNDKEYLMIRKDMTTYAAHCCEQAFFIDKRTGSQKCKKGMAVEHLTYAMEVLKHLYQGGTERIEIYSYAINKDEFCAEIRHVIPKRELRKWNGSTKKVTR